MNWAEVWVYDWGNRLENVRILPAAGLILIGNIMFISCEAWDDTSIKFPRLLCFTTPWNDSKVLSATGDTVRYWILPLQVCDPSEIPRYEVFLCERRPRPAAPYHHDARYFSDSGCSRHWCIYHTEFLPCSVQESSSVPSVWRVARYVLPLRYACHLDIQLFPIWTNMDNNLTLLPFAG